jgi:multicomponent Na+:H+ antiporter subunit G
MSVLEWLSAASVLLGAFFFFAGTVGLLRFPDVYTRLHALTKADNVGLGLVAIGVLLRADGPGTVVKVLLIWALALLTAATVGQLVARAADRDGVRPWRRP